jgi:general stress protein YciG
VSHSYRCKYNLTEGAIMATDDRGFASMSEKERREIARKGGQSQGAENNPGNFANDSQKASEAGRKGGENSHSGGNSR